MWLSDIGGVLLFPAFGIVPRAEYHNSPETLLAYSHYETGQRTPNSDILFKLAGLYHISVEDLMQFTLEIDRTIYYDAPAPTPSCEDLTGFIEYFNNPNNQKKYQLFNNLERELLYYFEKISEVNKKEIIEFTKIKARRNQ